MAQGQGTILNDDAAPSLRIADVNVRELNGGSRDVAFNLTLSAASDLPVTVHFATANGTATAGSDYTAASGTGWRPPLPGGAASSRSRSTGGSITVAATCLRPITGDKIS